MSAPLDGGDARPASDEARKLQQHLSLLRAEYVKLNAKYQELQRAHSLATAAGGGGGHAQGGTFAARILRAVGGLFNQPQYSDLKIRLKSGEYCAHKFVLAARSEAWKQLDNKQFLDWTHMDPRIGHALLYWVYTDSLDYPPLPSSSSPSPADAADADSFTLDLMRTGNAYQLRELLSRCEEQLMGSVGVANCIRYYATADEIGAESLKNHCSELIAANWDEFSSVDFADMTSTLLYTMLKTKTAHPLHSAVRLRREDVVFLYLIEFGHELSDRVNSCDDRDCLPLDLALSTRQESLAATLLEHKADINRQNGKGHSLLQTAIARDDSFSANFLLSRGADVKPATPYDLNTPLHLAAKFPNMRDVVKKLIQCEANVNAQNRECFTPLHLAVESRNHGVTDLLLESGASTELKSSDGLPPLWFALKGSTDYGEGSLAEKLVARGASTSSICGFHGDSLLHLCARDRLETAGLFLVGHKCDVDATNAAGETPLHLAAANSLERLVKQMMEPGGANPNLQTVAAAPGQAVGPNGPSRQTALHLAIAHKHVGVINAILEQHSGCDNAFLRPNLDLKNSADQTPLGLALSNGLHDIAVRLLKGGASVNVTNAAGLTLLHCAILEGDSEGAIFLLDNGADIDMRTGQGETPLELAIQYNLPSVMECLCRKGADMTASSGGGGGGGKDPPLWTALQKDEDLASILVRHGVDTDGWCPGPDDCQQTLLHRAIDENLEDSACFLIRSGCDLNSPRRVGPDGRGGEEAHDLATPLHLCAQWGQERVIRVLVEHGAVINAKDVEGKTPLHLAIENAHHPIINLLLLNSGQGVDLNARDKSGLSPFATAMAFKNNKAAQAILQIEPQAAEQYDARGRNFLHTAVMKNDLESVLFLLSINVGVNSRTQDANLLTPLLLAVQVGNDLIVRHLILAGASVTVNNTSEQTSLHIAAENNSPVICSVLLQNSVDASAVDNRGNNALHLAVKEGHLAVVRTLLQESNIDAEAANNKGRNPLHVLAIFGKENSAAIFELILECLPNYPINKPDPEGNSPLLLAYTRGQGGLCRSLVKSGAILGTMNQQGVSLFNYQVASKQLLFRLLDFLGQEPTWGEGDNCEECGQKFGITTRKHHCRHCGRLLCSKCSDHNMPILKYNLPKPVRVCDICADVLTIGPGMTS